MIALGDLVLYAAIPVVALVAAAVFASFRPTGPRMRSAIMHLAAGVVFAVVAIELLPPIVHSSSIVVVAIGFALGAALMLVLRQLLGHGEEDEHEGEAAEEDHEKSATGMIVAIAIDLVVDGVMLGLGFAAGERAGLLLAVALTLETLSLGLATATTLRKKGAPVRRVIGVAMVLALAIVIGAAIGGFGLRFAPAWIVPGMLSFGAAALLFLVTEELLEEAHEVKESPALTSMFFVGFLALMVLEMAGGAHT